MRRMMMLMLVGFALSACGGDAKNPQPEAERESGTVDYCERFGWYGDGHCDEICDEPDPDCSEPSNNISPGPGPVPPPDPSPPPPDPGPECDTDGVGWAREYLAYGDACDEIDFDCDDWVEFRDQCGCGCEEPQNGPTCDYLWERGQVDFVSEDPEQCAEIRFACAEVEGSEQFFDEECGCGCIYPWNVGPLACLDDSKPDVDRLGDIDECTLIDFFCAEGWTYFYDECGCGCRQVCSDDFECPNGYCQLGVDAEPMCVYPICDDGSEVLCDALPPDCPDGQVAATINGCYQCLDARSCGPPMGL